MSKSKPSLILERAAREALAPLGVSQMGRTRTWLDDRRWYAIFVDFEPSDFSQGSYLSIGINWLWSEKDYWSFDVGDRVTEYVEYESDAQFEPEAQRLATRAAREVTRYRARFATATHAARHYGVLLGGGLGFRERYHAGVLRGLLGHRWRAGWHFRRFCAEARGGDLDWEIEAARRAARLRALTADPPAFRREIRGAIERTRALMGMPAVDGDPLRPVAGA
jgi:hypothetical protein